MQQVSATNSKIIHWSSPVKSSEFNSLTNSEPRNSLTQKQFHQVLKYQTCRYTKRSVTSRYLQVWLYQCKKQSPRRVLWKICRPATLLIKRLWHRCFPVNFAKFLRIPFFTEHLWWLLLQWKSFSVWSSYGKMQKMYFRCTGKLLLVYFILEKFNTLIFVVKHIMNMNL